MKHKLLIIMIAGLLLVGLVTAGIGLSRSNTTIDISNADDTTLRNRFDLASVELELSDIDCYEDYCRAYVTQEGFVNKMIKVPRRYCMDWNVNYTCTDWDDYSDSEIRDLIDAKIEIELNKIADATRNRTEVDTIGGGLITKK